MKTVSEEKLTRYFDVSMSALEKAFQSKNKTNLNKERDDFLDMISRYIKDAEYFKNKGDYVNAFAALNYAHGWLDAGARLGIFDVKDSKLFAVDND